jgi:hypothetical protein
MLHDDLSFGVSRDKAALVDVAKSVRTAMEDGRLSGGTEPATAATDGLDAKSRDSLERVRTKIIPFVDDEDGKRLQAMCSDLENATGADTDTCREALDAESRKYAYLF